MRKGLIVAVLCASFVSFSAKVQAQFGLIREVYNNVTGGLPGLQNNPNFPGNPALSEIISEFETPGNIGNNYGQRVRGYIEAPQTGEYIFWIASDDQSELYLSNNEQPANRSKIAEALFATGPRNWFADGAQQSTPITLEAGRRYYIEALMVEMGGDDYLAVRWQLPDGTIEEPIPNERLFVELIPPQIARQPQNVTVEEGQNATFTVQYANRAPVAVQWFKNDVEIPGATNTTLVLTGVRIADSGARIVARATNFFATEPVSSAVAFLNVRPDTTPPTIVAAQTAGENDLLTIAFSEPLAASSVSPLSNFELIGGPRVLGASLDQSGTILILQTTPMTPGQTYTLIVNGVRDRAAQPNTIELDSTVDFSFGYSALQPELVYGKAEQPGPSSRNTGLVISEIMYHPSPQSDGRNIEFIEIYNSQEFIESVGGYRIAGAVEYTFPNGTFIPARGYLVVAAVPADIQVRYGLPRAYGPYSGALPDAGTIQLLNSQGALLLEVEYDNDPPWPAAADGAGHSLVLWRPSYGEADPRAWTASQFIGGTPGRGETFTTDAYAGLVINEFLANSDLPAVDFIELYNYSTREIDLSGVVIQDENTVVNPAAAFRIPNGTRIPPLGFLRFDENQLGFALSSGGERILLRNPNQTRVIDSVKFGPQPAGVSTGRYPDGSPDMRQLAQATPGLANTQPRLPEVIINEVMYNPVSGNGEEEYVELYNRSGQAINLRGWRLNDGVDFTFPQDLILPAGGYMVVAKNVELLRSNHPSLSANAVIGNFNGNLANDGERIALERPEILVSSNNGQLVTNLIYVTVDELSYGTGGRWPAWADGGGSSMELLDPNSNNDEASNWADSDESAKSEWVTIERRGILDWGSTNFPPSYPSRNLHVLLMDQGEALIDNVQVIPDGGGNVVNNPGFANGMRDWLAGGTHEDSSLAPGAGPGGDNALHIRAAERGDTSANRIRARLNTGLTNGMIVTLRADVRWLRGTPEILLRLHGNFLELAGTMQIPRNLGTPGAPNSRRSSNTGPVIKHVQHNPVVPAANQEVRVIAQMADPDRVALALLHYKVDPATNYTRVAMSYSGAGFYSALLPGQPAGTNLVFFVEALDALGNTNRFPADAPNRNAVIVFGDSSRPGNFGIYRLWVSSTNLNRWRLREQASNKQLDATFVYNNDRIIYNMGTLYSGSPFHWNGYNGPLGNGANYLMVMPDDDLFLGQTDFVLNLPSNIGSDNTGVREQVFFWMADQMNQPANYRRYHHLSINGVNRNASTIFEDAQQPSRAFIEQWFPDDPDGELYKIEDWFEYSDTFSRFNVDGRISPFYTRSLTNNQPELRRELYRWWLRKRAVRGSHHDYSELFELIQAVNHPDREEFVARTEALIDIDEWLGAIALRHAVGDWDSFGYNRGKNMYAYKPQNGKWKLLHWDVAFAFGLGDSTTWDLFDTAYFDGTQDIVTKRMLETPVFRRAYLRALYEIAHGPMVSSRVDPVIEARFQALVNNSIPLVPPAAVKSWIADRREFIVAQLGAYNSGFSITSHTNNFTTNRNTLVLTGTAPVNVKTILINGVEYPIEWTSVNAWRTRVALRPQQNILNIEGRDSRGNPIAGASTQLRVNVTGATEAIDGRVIISEILADPLNPGAEFVEIQNTARLTSYDLSGYSINGLGFTFPSGSVIPPGGFLVVARDAMAFGERFGFTLPIAGIFDGAVDNQGETLSLLPPGTNQNPIASVRFDGAAPWPVPVNGASLQLIDSAQDISRVANWTSVPGVATPGATNSVRATLPAFPPVWVNEVQPLNSTGPTDSAGDRDPWVEIYNPSASTVSLSGLYLTDDFNQLQKWPFPANAALAPGQRTLVWLDGEAAESTPTEWHANFPLRSANGAIAVVMAANGFPRVLDYLRFGQVPADQSFGAFPEGQAIRRFGFFRATPGAPNDLSAPPARVVFNEWMASNTQTIQDPDDLDFDDWFELYNAGDQPADISGYTITDNLENPGKFRIPEGTVIPARGFLLVWADEENATNGQLHVNFRLGAGGESLGLFAPDGSNVDTVTFGPQSADISQGRNPDGGTQIVSFTTPTPGASNTGRDPNALQFRRATISGGQMLLEWNGEAGASYRVEFKNSLGDASWTTLRTVSASGATVSTTDAVTGEQRFYRVVRP